MDENRYNTKVRRAMSDEYVRTSKEKARLENELVTISQQLADDEFKNNTSYKEYKELKHKAETIQREIYRLYIEHETWDKARGICMDIADEEAIK